MHVRTLTLLVCTLAPLALASFQAEARTLKIATVMPDGSGWMVEMRKAAEAIKAKTEGRVKIKFYPGGVMGNDKTVMRKIRMGQLQGGAFPSGGLTAVYPDIELYSLPLLFRSYEEVEFVRGKLDGKLRQGLEEAGYVALAIGDGGFAFILSKDPVRKVEDLTASKVWVPEGDIMSQVAFEVADVAPVPLPIPDVYTALQTGLIDTVAAPPMGAIAFQWHTKVRYMTDVPLMYLIGIVMVDKKAFSKLTKGDQEIVKREVDLANQRLDEEARTGDTSARKALQSQGVEFVKPSSDDEIERWHRISQQAIEKLRAMDRYSEAMLAELTSLLARFRGEQSAAR